MDNPPFAITQDSAKPSGDEQRRFNQAADYSAQFSGRALLIVRDGEILFERYDNGWSATRPHMLASGTKSFTGVLAMMAVEDGLLTLDELVCDTITEWRGDPQKSKVTIRQLLTLSSGLPSGNEELANGRSGPRLLGELAERRAERLGINGSTPRADNLNQKAIELDLATRPGEKFQYGPSHFYVFSEVLQRKLQASDLPTKTTLAYLTERLLKPIGIDVARIGRDRSGNPNLPGGMALTAREWAKFGQFVLDGGRVKQSNGETNQVLKRELLMECFAPSATNENYGLTWWLRAANPEADLGAILGRQLRSGRNHQILLGSDGQPIRIYMAAGLGKQRLYVIPDQNMVIVRFAEASSEGLRFNDLKMLKPILGLGEQPFP